MKKTKLFHDGHLRQTYASRGDLQKLFKSYTPRAKKNINTKTFWNEKMSKGLNFRKQDLMTKDRIFNAVDFVGENKEIDLLDVGAGYGYFEEILSKQKNKIRIHGIDISTISVKNLKKRFKGEFKVGIINKIPFENNKFDVVVALEILEHLRAEESMKAYKEIKRVLKKSGIFVCSVPVFETYTEKYNPNAHMRAYTPKLFLEELKINGFTIINKKLFFAFSSFYGIKTLISKFINRWNPNVILVKTQAKK